MVLASEQEVVAKPRLHFALALLAPSQKLRFPFSRSTRSTGVGSVLLNCRLCPPCPCIAWIDTHKPLAKQLRYHVRRGCVQSLFREPKITVYERHLRRTTTQTRLKKQSQLMTDTTRKVRGLTVHLPPSFLCCSFGPCTKYKRHSCGVWAPLLQLNLHQALLNAPLEVAKRIMTTSLGDTRVVEFLHK